MHIFSVYIPQSVIAWVIIGLIAGWLAGTGLARPRLRLHRRYHPGLGGRGPRRLDFFQARHSFGGGLIYSIAAATVGAVILVAIAQNIFRRRKLIPMNRSGSPIYPLWQWQSANFSRSHVIR
jgi:uncharacterized membrane protein YeaQ/YmgE (transglycosylase-associated protein family)